MAEPDENHGSDDDNGLEDDDDMDKDLLYNLKSFNKLYWTSEIYNTTVCQEKPLL